MIPYIDIYSFICLFISFIINIKRLHIIIHLVKTSGARLYNSIIYSQYFNYENTNNFILFVDEPKLVCNMGENEASR